MEKKAYISPCLITVFLQDGSHLLLGSIPISETQVGFGLTKEEEDEWEELWDE